MKKRLFSVLCILSLLLIASCDLLGGSLKQYIDQYTTYAAIEAHSFNEATPRSAYSDNSCLGLDNTVFLLLRNPMKLECVFSYKFANTKIQTYFNQYYNNGITFASTESDNSIYKMEFPKDFLKDIDSGNVTDENGTPIKDISGKVFVWQKDTERDFGDYALSLLADTPPELKDVCLTLDADADNSSKTPHYVICFKIKKPDGYYDIDTIKINNKKWSVSKSDGKITLSPDDDNMLINPDLNTLTIFPVEAGGATGTIEDGYDLFYYFTTDIRKSTDTSYTITITDTSGLSAQKTVSSKTDMLTKLEISETPSIITADNYGMHTIIITHDGKTLSGNSISSPLNITYTVTDAYGKTVAENTLEGKTSVDVNLPIGKDYILTARASCKGYLSNSDITTDSFSIKHSPQFFVSPKGSENGDGTLTSPCSSFSTCLDGIKEYTADWSAPADGVYINVLGDITPDDTFSGYLIDNDGYTGKVTIRGMDEGLSTTKRTIDLNSQSSSGNRGALKWTGGNLTVENMKVTNAKGTNLSGGAICLKDTAESSITATLNNCNIEENMIQSSSTDFSGAGVAVITENKDSNVSIKSCTITNNVVFGTGNGAGISVITANAQTNVSISDCEIKANNIASNGKGAGIYCNGNLSLSGKVIINNNSSSNLESNVYLPTGATLTITGKLSSDSCIGVSAQGAPTSADDPPVTFATYASALKPDAGILVCDEIGQSGEHIPIKLYDTEAQFEYSNDANGSGSLVVPTQLYDDIQLTITENDSGDNQVYTLSFTENGNASSEVTVSSVTMKYRTSLISESTTTWQHENGVITLYPALISKIAKSQQIPTITVAFEYNGHGYTCSFQPVVE